MAKFKLTLLLFFVAFLSATTASELTGQRDSVKVIHPNNHNRGGVFLGTAYDSIRGNPHGNDLAAGGLDPGLKRTVKVLKTTNLENPLSDCPDQANCVPVGAACSRTVEETLVLDSWDYLNTFSSSLNFEASGTVSIKTFYKLICKGG